MTGGWWTDRRLELGMWAFAVVLLVVAISIF